MVAFLAIFFLATVGSKAILGLAILYYFLPDDTRCSACNGETVSLVPPRGARLLSRLFHLQSRWCLECGKTSTVRGNQEVRVWVGPATRPTERV